MNKALILECVSSICSYSLKQCYDTMGIRKGEKRQERCSGEKMQFYSLFSKEAVVITKVDQGLVIKSKAAETISHCKALKTYVFS